MISTVCIAVDRRHVDATNVPFGATSPANVEIDEFKDDAARRSPPIDTYFGIR